MSVPSPGVNPRKPRISLGGPDRSSGDEQGEFGRLRVMAELEGLHQHPTRKLCGVERTLDLGRFGVEGFLAQNVLAGLERRTDHSTWRAFGSDT